MKNLARGIIFAVTVQIHSWNATDEIGQIAEQDLFIYPWHSDFQTKSVHQDIDNHH